MVFICVVLVIFCFFNRHAMGFDAFFLGDTQRSDTEMQPPIFIDDFPISVPIYFGYFRATFDDTEGER
jgi:hypothetical protein